MQLGMTTPMDLGLDAGAGGLGEMFDLKEVDAHGKAKVKLRVPVPDGAEESSADEGAEEDSEAETEFSDEEDARIHGLEATMDNLYDEYQNRLLERDAKAKVRQMKQKKRMAEGGEFTGIGSDEEASDDDEEEEDEELDQAMRAKPKDSDSDSSASEDEAPAVGQKRSRGGHLITKLQDDATKARLATDKERKAALWYDQAVFKNVPGLEDLLQVSDGDDDDGSAEEAESDSEEEKTAFEPDEVDRLPVQMSRLTGRGSTGHRMEL
jgi:AdoMet-dependent rRNA methyltransferase SPB1